MEMTKLGLAKGVAKFVVGTSTAYVVSNAAKGLVEPKNNLQKVQLVIGGLAIGGLVAKQAEDWAVDRIDGYVTAWREAKAIANKKKEDSE